MKNKTVIFCFVIVCSLIIFSTVYAFPIKEGPLQQIIESISKLEWKVEDITKQHRSDINNLQDQLDDIKSVTENVSYLNIPAPAFRIDTGYGNWEVDMLGSNINNFDDEGDARLSAPVFLPHNATILNVTLCASDHIPGDSLNQVIYIELLKRNATDIYRMANVSSVDGSFALNFDDSIENDATVDNQQNMYWLMLRLPPRPLGIGAPNFHYVLITYQYPT